MLGLLKKILTVVFAAACCFAAETNTPERRIESNNVIISNRDPKVRIALPKSVQYVGADRWGLYDIADCELHAFVEADSQQSVQRLYWIQFEGYLPSKPELKHQYGSPWHTTIGGLDFYVDTSTSVRDEKTTAGSDAEHIRALLQGKGYRMPAATMYARLVHLLDEQKRKELMIIYAEDLSPTGFTAADVQKDGKAYKQWAAIEKGLLERAKNKIKIDASAAP